jgi:hypothetical protein
MRPLVGPCWRLFPGGQREDKPMPADPQPSRPGPLHHALGLKPGSAHRSGDRCSSRTSARCHSCPPVRSGFACSATARSTDRGSSATADANAGCATVRAHDPVLRPFPGIGWWWSHYCPSTWNRWLGPGSVSRSHRWAGVALVSRGSSAAGRSLRTPERRQVGDGAADADGCRGSECLARLERERQVEGVVE